MLWRLNAANRAPPCGVPSFRLPLSSSTARNTFHSEPALQPFDVKVVPAVQENDLVAVLRERYQRRARIVQGTPGAGVRRGRGGGGHNRSGGTYGSPWPFLPPRAGPPGAP